MRSAIFSLRRKSCSNIQLEAHNLPALGSALESHHDTDWQALERAAAQHLSLDDLNGFPLATKNIHLLSPLHSPPKPPYTIEFFTVPVSPHSCAHSMFCMVRLEWVRKCKWERDTQNQTAFVLLYTYTVLVYECGSDWALSAGTGTFLMAGPQPALWRISVQAQRHLITFPIVFNPSQTFSLMIWILIECGIQRHVGIL